MPSSHPPVPSGHPDRAGRSEPQAHTAHDELLVARLFGDDLDDSERAAARALLGECGECAALFAELGRTAAAIASLPTPPRPRDFTLTDADAARLAPRRLRLPVLARWVRPLGTMLSGVGALALAFLVVTQTSTLQTQTFTRAPAAQSSSAIGGAAASLAPYLPSNGNTFDQVPIGSAQRVGPESQVTGTPGGKNAVSPMAIGTDHAAPNATAPGVPNPVTTVAPVIIGPATSPGSADKATPGGSSPAPAGGALDLRLAAAVAAVLLLVAGLGLLLTSFVGRPSRRPLE